MQNRGISLITLLAFALGFLSLGAMAQGGQQGFDKQDLTGVWMLGRGGGGALVNEGIRLTEWSNQEPPWTPQGLAAFNANKPGKGPRRAPPAFGNDPLGGANPVGLARLLEYNRPHETFQFEDKVVQIFEWNHTWRIIWTDGRDLPENPDPWWYGHSIGRWEGDTFVVETVGLDSRAWLDEWGTPASPALRLEERWRRVDSETIEFTMTFNDPDIFAQPWTSDTRTFKLQGPDSPYAEIYEVIFAPIDEQDFNQTIRDPAGGLEP